eukprot:6523533-Prymnesium_polylepis.5
MNPVPPDCVPYTLRWAYPAAADSLGYFMLTCLLGLFAAWWVGQVVTCGAGRARPAYFCFLPSYWLSGAAPGGAGAARGAGDSGEAALGSLDVDVAEEVC